MRTDETAQTRIFSRDVPSQTGWFFSIAPVQDNVNLLFWLIVTTLVAPVSFLTASLFG